MFEKPKTKHYNMIDIGTRGAKPKTYSRKKMNTKPLNLADFTIPGYRRKKEENQKSKEKNRQDTTNTPTQKTSQKTPNFLETEYPKWSVCPPSLNTLVVILKEI